MTALKRPSLCGGGDCVEVFWAGRAVNVRDTKLDPLLSPVLRFEVWQWRELLAAIVQNVTHPAVSVGDDGTVRLGVEHLHGDESLTFTEQEWSDFARGVRDGWYERYLLQFYAAHGLAVRGIGATARLSGPESPGRGGDEGRTAGSVSADRSGGVAAGTVSGGRSRGSAVPVAAELGPLDDELDRLTSPPFLRTLLSIEDSPAGRDLSGNPREGFPDAVATTDRPGSSCGCTEMVADAACTDHGMRAFLRSLLSTEDSPAGRPVDASTGVVVLSLADRPGSDAAGTGVPPDLVPAAQPRVWSLAEEPGADVTAVKDAERSVWKRAAEYHCRACNRWSPDWDPDVEIEWSPLLVEYGPLTDATRFAAPLVPTDGAS